jgi:hypothetical protein
MTWMAMIMKVGVFDFVAAITSYSILSRYLTCSDATPDAKLGLALLYNFTCMALFFAISVWTTGFLHRLACIAD